MTRLTAQEWDAFLAAYPAAHLLQTAAWGESKAAFGWQPEYITAGGCGAQVLFRRLPLGLTIAYIPRGPVGKNWAALWPEIDVLCRQRHSTFLKVEPDLWEPVSGDLQDELPGFMPSAPIQPARTVVVSLEGSEEEWLARMKQKTRYNIRLAERKEIIVRPTTDLDSFYRLMTLTGQRDGFGVHARGYYQRAFENFSALGQAVLLQAEFQGQALAALMAFSHGPRAWYLYGASSDEERNRMPAYLLQWEAMRWAAAQGCLEYDLYGIPDVDEEQLEAEFSGRSEGLWGVYRFKRGFGGEVRRSAGAWDRVYQPLMYRLYRWYLVRRSREG